MLSKLDNSTFREMEKLFFIAILSLSLLCEFATSQQNFYCIDNNGTDTQWWFMYFLPNTANNTIISYLYYDATMSATNITDFILVSTFLSDTIVYSSDSKQFLYAYDGPNKYQ